jgi:hypothetical protein
MVERFILGDAGEQEKTRPFRPQTVTVR